MKAQGGSYGLCLEPHPWMWGRAPGARRAGVHSSLGAHSTAAAGSACPDGSTRGKGVTSHLWLVEGHCSALPELTALGGGPGKRMTQVQKARCSEVVARFKRKTWRKLKSML